MKLLNKYRHFTYSSLCIVVLIGSAINYYLFRYAIHRTTDDVLNEYRVDIEEYAEHHGTLQPLLEVNSKFGDIRLVSNDYDLSEMRDGIKDTLVYSHYQEEKVVYRKLVFPVITKTQNYQVSLMLPALEEDDLVETVLISLFVFVVLFILLTTLIDLSFTRQILRPFHQIVAKIKTYNLDNHSNVPLAYSDIEEFRDLSQILTDMMNRINEDYYSMKEFLEYTSHEIQTPLAVIQLKLDALNQKNIEDPEILSNISSIQNSLKRVVRFNRSVLFMAKIKNNQFLHKKQVGIREYIDYYYHQYEELLAMKQITFTVDCQEDLVLTIHPVLADNLIQNLITNAVQHNYDGGSIQVTITASQLSVTNTFNEELPEGDLFSKYTYTKDRKESNGLGLTIVKTICEKNQITLRYNIQNHTFCIALSKTM